LTGAQWDWVVRESIRLNVRRRMKVTLALLHELNFLDALPRDFFISDAGEASLRRHVSTILRRLRDSELKQPSSIIYLIEETSLSDRWRDALRDATQRLMSPSTKQWVDSKSTGRSGLSVLADRYWKKVFPR
jgi:hypothetical protein